MSWCARAALASHRVACKRPLTQKPAWHRTGFRCSRTVPAVSHDVSQCVLAVDIGTTSLKAILLAPDGTALRVSTRGYKRGTHAGTTGCSGAMEQDPEDWVGAFCEAARDVFEPFADDASPAGVALSGQMQNIVLVRGGKSLRPALLYSDVRAVGEADEIRERLGKNDARGGSIDIDAKLANFKGAAAVLSKWKWLAKHDSALLKKSESMLLGAHSCLAYVLCGGAKDAAQCDVTTASTTGLLRPDDFGDGDDSARWALDAISEIAGADQVHLLPTLTRGFAPPPVGAISQKTIHQLDLPKNLRNVPVFHGVGDLASTTIGALGICCKTDHENEPQNASYLYLGTSGWVARCVLGNSLRASGRVLAAGDAERKAGTFTLLHPDPALRIVAASMTTAGGNVEWARRTFLDSGCNAVTDFDALANAAPSGSDGVLFLPHLNGERSPFADPTARGAFINLSPASTKKHLCRSVLEGVGYHYRGLFDALEVPMDSPDFGETNGASPGVPFLGGGANSAVWTQVIADCARRKLVTVGSDASLVAARGCSAGAFVYLNLWGAGNKAPAGYFPFDGGNDVSDASITQDLSPKKESKVFLPNQSAAAGHDAAYLVWARLHKALAEAGAGELV